MKTMRVYPILLLAALLVGGGKAAQAQGRPDLHLFYFNLAGGATTKGMSGQMEARLKHQLDSLKKAPNASLAVFSVNNSVVTTPGEIDQEVQDQSQGNYTGAMNPRDDLTKLRGFLYKYEYNTFRTIYLHIYVSSDQYNTIATSYSPFYHFFIEELTTLPLADAYQIELLYPKVKGQPSAAGLTFLSKHISFRNPLADYTILAL